MFGVLQTNPEFSLKNFPFSSRPGLMGRSLCHAIGLEVIVYGTLGVPEGLDRKVTSHSTFSIMHTRS